MMPSLLSLVLPEVVITTHENAGGQKVAQKEKNCVIHTTKLIAKHFVKWIKGWFKHCCKTILSFTYFHWRKFSETCHLWFGHDLVYIFGNASYNVSFLSLPWVSCCHWQNFPDSKVHGANMGLTWVLSAPDGPHVGPMNLVIRVIINQRLPWTTQTVWQGITHFLFKADIWQMTFSHAFSGKKQQSIEICF